MAKNLVESLKDLLEKDWTKSKLEESIGLPKNSLSSVFNGKKEMPTKWGAKIEAFLMSLTPATEVSVNGEGKLKEKPHPKRMDAMNDFVGRINNDFGEGAVMIMGNQTKEQRQLDVISTGSIGLDEALGVGGLPRGRMIEIYGLESSGKTTIAMHVMANAQKKGLRCLLVDAENSFDAEYAHNLGMNVDELMLCQPSFGEQGFEIADRFINEGKADVVVFDSVAALLPKAELEGEMGDSKMGLHARLMSQVCRKMVGSINKKNALAIFINQVRNKIGVVYGNPEVTTGGMALQFYASVRLEVKRLVQLKDGDAVFGNKTKVIVKKNKVSPPFKMAEFDIIYGVGINRTGEILDKAVEKGVVVKSGSWYSYKNTDGEFKLGQGRDSVVEFLNDNPDLLSEIQKASPASTK